MTVLTRDNSLQGNAPWFDSSLDSVWSQCQLPQAQACPSASLRYLLVRLGLWQICLRVTLLGALASTGIALVVNILMHRASHDFWVSLLISASIPMLISPPVDAKAPSKVTRRQICHRPRRTSK